ncbi:MAG TPA: serine hydroxymethyltransferase [Candidatus Dojkabacteria bacterium]|nr:serine hydroxymethyltransferase [Candidatus Dojkabacteria bacterium]HQF37081.1 serine hydroxymethyltransferase [Candidatus Dojkabacteria bacterium]
MSQLSKVDPQVDAILKSEIERQQKTLSLIPSENFASKAVREVVGSVFMNKYSEGYPGKRFYEGNSNIDDLERLAIKRAKKAFSLPKNWGVNVQALSGSSANIAVLLALLTPGDKILSMYLPDGGHLSHGWSFSKQMATEKDKFVYRGGERKVNVVSKIFSVIQYKSDPKTQVFNYDEIERIALEEKPRLIITGGTAYPREIDYKRMRDIANKVGAYYLADIAHEAGLIASGVNKSPVGIADVVTMTTHKTLRCNRGAIILAKKEIIKLVNSSIFPGLQGGPHNHSIAGIAVGLGEVLTSEFKDYARQIVENAQLLSTELIKRGFNVVTGGTDKHLILIDLNNFGVLGKKFARALAYAGIVANKNTMPGETRSPNDPSAIRLGTPFVTTRGMKEKEMKQIAKWVYEVMEICQNYKSIDDFDKFESKIASDSGILRIRAEVSDLCIQFPLDV